jgi:gas vesicle protein
MAPKVGKRKLEVEVKESLKERREPKSDIERKEHAIQMVEHRINASMNMWFQKQKKKVHKSLEDLDEEIEEDILIVATRKGDVLSFWDKYCIQDINNLVPILQDVNHPYCICTRVTLNHFWTRCGPIATEQQYRDFKDTQKYLAGKFIYLFQIEIIIDVLY